MKTVQKKIAFFMPTLASGGGERVMVDLMNYFAAREYEVTGVLMQKKGLHVPHLSPHVRVVELGTNRFVAAWRRTVAFLRAEKPDIAVSSHMHFNLVLLAAIRFANQPTRSVIRLGIPLSIVFKRFTSFKDRFFVPALTRWLYPGASAIVANSHGVARDAARVAGMSPDRITVIPNPKDSARIIHRAQEFVPDVCEGAKPCVVSVGRLTYQKGVDTLLEAFALFKAKNGGRLVMVGDGGERSKLEALADTLGIASSVAFVGTQANPYPYMQQADLFVLASRWEGLPNVLGEALVLGKPIVATDAPAGGSREILDPSHAEREVPYLTDTIEQVEHGVLVPVDRPDLLAEGMEKALAHHQVKGGMSVSVEQTATAYERLWM